jgi:hypothetical protein
MGAPLQTDQQTETNPQNKGVRIGILAILFLLALGYLYRPGGKEAITDQKNLNWDDVAYVDENGDVQLKEWRMLELERQLQELEEAEQYALVALSDGFYECYYCAGGKYYLQEGMIWKYGITRKGVDRRYRGLWLSKMRLAYRVQFRGTNHECQIEEKRKIFLYPMHHDNRIRKPSDRLARPPGNKNDN